MRKEALFLPAVFLIATMATAAFHMTMFPVAALAPDSASYLNADGMRSAGYPIFLALAKAAGLDVSGIVMVQTAMLAASVGALCWAMVYASGRMIWGLLLLGVLCGNPFLWRYGAQILSEALFIPLLCLMTASALMAVRHEAQRRWLMLSAVCLAVAVLVRPVAVAMLPGLLMVALGLSSNQTWARRALNALAIVIVVVGVTFVAGSNDNRSSDTGKGAIKTHGGLALLGQAAPLLRAGQTGLPPDREARIVAAIEQTRAWMNGLSSWEAWVLSREIAWNPLLYDILGPELETLDVTRVAKTAILASPFEYLRVAAAGLYSLWTLPQLQGSTRWRDTLEPQLSTLPQAITSTPWRESVKRLPDPLAWAARLVNAGLTALAFLAACLALLGLLTAQRIDPVLVVGGAMGLAAHGYLVAVALFSASLPRYQMPVLAIMCVAALCLILHVARRWYRRP